MWEQITMREWHLTLYATSSNTKYSIKKHIHFNTNNSSQLPNTKEATLWVQVCNSLINSCSSAPYNNLKSKKCSSTTSSTMSIHRFFKIFLCSLSLHQFSSLKMTCRNCSFNNKSNSYRIKCCNSNNWEWICPSAFRVPSFLLMLCHLQVYPCQIKWYPCLKSYLPDNHSSLPCLVILWKHSHRECPMNLWKLWILQL